MRIFALLFSCYFVAFSQTQPKLTEKKILQSTPKIDVQAVAKPQLQLQFSSLLKKDSAIRSLDAKLRASGFVAEEASEHVWGVKSIQEKDGKVVVSSTSIKDYRKIGSKDAAALGQVTIKASGQSATYSFYLVAPDGNVKATREYTVDKSFKTIPAHSWWTCVEGQLKNATGKCAASLGTCAIGATFTWAGYLTCVAASCAESYCLAAACCACDSSWWCRWAVGSCSQKEPEPPPPPNTGPKLPPTPTPRPPVKCGSGEHQCGDKCYPKSYPCPPVEEKSMRGCVVGLRADS